MDKSQLSNGQLGMLAAGISLFNSLAWQLSWARSVSALREAREKLQSQFLSIFVETLVSSFGSVVTSILEILLNFDFAIQTGIWWYLVNSLPGFV